MPFDHQPVLTGVLIHARPLRADDYDPLLAVASDPLIWEQHPAKERATKEGFSAFFNNVLSKGGALLVSAADTGEVIGTSSYLRYDDAASEVEIGYTFLARAYWGGRYNGELKRLMIAHAFKYVQHVVFLVSASNLRSQEAVRRIGGVFVGPRKDASSNEALCYRVSAATSIVSAP